MTRGGFVFSSLGFVAAVAVAAVGALLLQPAQAAVGPVPPEALALPGDASFVVGLDVKKLVASSFYQRQGGASAQSRLEAFKELHEKTGLDPEQDVSAIVLTGAQGAGAQTPSGAAVILGTFDEVKVKEAAERRPGIRLGRHEGVALYSYGEGDSARSFAFLGRGALVLGQDRIVRATLDNRSGGKTGLASNASLVALLQRVKPGATFWMVGDQSVLQGLPKGVPGSGAGASGGSLTLPALKQVVVSGDVEPQLALDATGDTADEAGAKSLADMLRGLIGLLAMQAAQKPELAGLASAFNVTQAGAQVTVTVRIPPELLDALQKPSRPPAQ
ncbi:MAG TPA: hypothetical protein VFM88_11705 [Vicinamibacteria bacterium]|nr:hypothetical protein [Vicinamibacteria bacterium]